MPSAPEKLPLLTVANVLTFARLVLLPGVIWAVITEHPWWAVVGMGLIWLTDILDGHAARYWGQAGEFGQALDSTVDFLLIYTLFIAFYASGILPTYQFVILYVGLIATLALQVVLMREGEEKVASTRWSKPTGALQYGYLIFLVVRPVLPPEAIWDHAGLVVFMVLALAIAINTVECVRLIRARS
jgi:phosphatidylglycerophosphate synthase